MEIINENPLPTFASSVISSSVVVGTEFRGPEGRGSETPSLGGSPPSRSGGFESGYQTPVLTGYQTPLLRQIAEDEVNEKRITAAFANASSGNWAGSSEDLFLATVVENPSCPPAGTQKAPANASGLAMTKGTVATSSTPVTTTGSNIADTNAPALPIITSTPATPTASAPLGAALPSQQVIYFTSSSSRFLWYLFMEGAVLDVAAFSHR